MLLVLFFSQAADGSGLAQAETFTTELPVKPKVQIYKNCQMKP